MIFLLQGFDLFLQCFLLLVLGPKTSAKNIDFRDGGTPSKINTHELGQKTDTSHHETTKMSLAIKGNLEFGIPICLFKSLRSLRLPSIGYPPSPILPRDNISYSNTSVNKKKTSHLAKSQYCTNLGFPRIAGVPFPSLNHHLGFCCDEL